MTRQRGITHLQTLDLTCDELVAEYLDLLNEYDSNNDKIIDINELGDASDDRVQGTITETELEAVNTAYEKACVIDSPLDPSLVTVVDCSGPAEAEAGSLITLGATIRNDNTVDVQGTLELGLDGSHAITDFVVSAGSTTTGSIPDIPVQDTAGSQDITWDLRDIGVA